MFFCRRNPLLTLVLLVLGIKTLRRNHWSEEERQSYRAKRREFRHKMREAFDVWDEPGDASTGNSERTEG